MRIDGIIFVGTRTRSGTEMGDFVHGVLGLERADVTGADADFFSLPNGSTFAVSPPDEDGTTERTVGLLVDDVEAAVAELRAAGIETDEMAETSTQRYVHFRAPDGHLYELVENLAAGRPPPR